MNAQAENTETFIKHGIILDANQELTVDSTHPRAVPITAINSLTGEIKHYMLRVTSKGGLCLV
jgi:hypothetical protein